MSDWRLWGEKRPDPHAAVARSVWAAGAFGDMRPRRSRTGLILFGLVFGAGLALTLSLDNPGRQIGVALGLAQSKVAAAAKRADIALNWVIYLNCDQVRSAGSAPLRRGDPGYAERLDPDGDGVACATARKRQARRQEH